MRLGGYMGKAWSARANDALERGLRPAPMVAKELGVSSEAVELHMRSPEWHHVGDDYEEVHFYDPDEAPLTDADAVDDAETARSFLRYVEMLNYDTRTFTVKPRVAGRFESEASDEAYALFTSRGTAVAKEAFEAEDEFRALVEKETASAEELRAAAKATLAAAKSGRKKMEAAAKAFLSEHKDWKRERPRRARRGANGLRYSLEEAFPATEAERAEIERAAKAKGTWLKAPNGNPTNLTPEQWVTVRTAAFKEWFGDWEKDARIEKLRRSEPLVFTGEEYKGKYELDARSAERYILDNLRGEYVNKDTGERISVSRRGVRKVLHHDVENEVHLKSITYIPQMLENAVFVSEELNAKSTTGFDSYRYYVCGLEIGGEQYTAKLVVGKLGRETYYDHVLSPIKKDTLLKGIGEIPSPRAQKKSISTEIRDKRLLSILQTNSSKIVDGNGEPLVVYHGTDADFTVFDRAKTRATMDIQGNFFSPWEDDARGYGSNVRRFFLNLRNPADENTGYHSLHEFEGQNGAGVKARERLVALGYDGVNNGGEEFIAFSPEQIKSATENVGTFDAGNPDIRYSLGGGARVLRAWHGSPHAFAAEEGAPFGRFGLSFVGTGEGAQAFGYGIYLSGKRGVAHGYAETLGDAKKAGRRILSDNYTRAFLKKHGLDVLDENPQHPLKDIFLLAFYVDQVKGRIEKYKTYYIGNSAVVGILKKLSPTKEMLDEYHVARMADFMSSKSSTITALDYLKSYKNGLDEYYQDGKQYLQLFKTTRQEQKAAKQAKENKELKQRIDEADDLYQRAKKLFDSEESAKKKYHHLYSVDISVAEDESNLLDWKGKLSKEQTSRIMSGMKARGVGDYWVGGVKHLSYSFKGVYKQLSMALGGDKAASLFLKELGFIGHKYPVGSFRNKFNDYDAGTNYVIYDTGATEITDAVRWLRNDSGVVYGYWDEGSGELHLNEDFADFDTPLHEWAHVWLSWVRKADARLAERALAVTKETQFYKRLREDKGSAYAGLSDDALAEERGACRISSEAGFQFSPGQTAKKCPL